VEGWERNGIPLLLAGIWRLIGERKKSFAGTGK